jgi:hypothetical protein
VPDAEGVGGGSELAVAVDCSGMTIGGVSGVCVASIDVCVGERGDVGCACVVVLLALAATDCGMLIGGGFDR